MLAMKARNRPKVINRKYSGKVKPGNAKLMSGYVQLYSSSKLYALVMLSGTIGFLRLYEVAPVLSSSLLLEY